MGSLINCDEWLHDLAGKGGPSLEVARRLMRAQIITGNRRGHILELGTEYVRRRITWSAQYGAIAAVTVRCSRCHWQAWLTDWVKAVDLTPAEVTSILADNTTANQRTLTAFLRRCPGGWYADAVLESIAAPDVSEG